MEDLKIKEKMASITPFLNERQIGIKISDEEFKKNKHHKQPIS